MTSGPFPERTLTALLLILSGLVFVVPGMMFTARVLWKKPYAQSARFLIWERGLVIAAFLISACGFALLESGLQATGTTAIGQVALLLYGLGAAALVVGETLWLHRQEWIPPLIAAHVILAFLGQVAFGVALLISGLTAAWAGWAAIIWPLACLIALATVWRKDFYYPWLSYPVPLLIGLALLAQPG